MLALEHTLVILLLLVSLLNAKPKLPPIAWVAIVAALALVLIAPSLPVALPWEWLSALLIPLLLWQTGRRLVNVRMPSQVKDIAIWLAIALGIGGILLLFSDQTAAGAMMFGLLAASMVWRSTEEDQQSTHLGQIGPLALAFLLAEIAPAVEAPGRYSIALLAGAGIGALVGYVAVHAAQRVSQNAWQNFLSVGQVYLAYAVATFFDLSGVAAAMVSVAVYLAYGARRGLWPEGTVQPKPLDSWPVFLVGVAALVFFAWQMHVPPTLILFLEVGLGLALIALVIWLGRSLRIERFLQENSYPVILLRVGFLLIPAIFLWPREALLDPLPLVIALITATLATIGTNYALVPLLNVYAWFDEAGFAIEDPDTLVQRVLVRDLMDPDCATIPATAALPEIARLFAEKCAECLPVINPEGAVVGVVTEHDLFVREERIPRTDRTYQALFKEPVHPEMLPEIYAKRGPLYVAADVMSTQVVWVKETSSIGEAVRLMVRFGYKCLPVLDVAPESGGKLVGVITRSGIVRLLANQEKEAS